MTEQMPFPWWRQALRTIMWISRGLVVGLGAGLLVGWVLWPLEYSEADPSIMEDHYQRDYTVMIATAYADDQDLDLARERLLDLDLDDVESWVMTVTVDTILQGDDPMASRFLVELATDMDLYSAIMDPYLPQQDGVEES